MTSTTSLTVTKPTTDSKGWMCFVPPSACANGYQSGAILEKSSGGSSSRCFSLRDHTPYNISHAQITPVVLRLCTLRSEPWILPSSRISVILSFIWSTSLANIYPGACLGGSLGGSSTPLAPRLSLQKYLIVSYSCIIDSRYARPRLRIKRGC